MTRTMPDGNPRRSDVDVDRDARAGLVITPRDIPGAVVTDAELEVRDLYNLVRNLCAKRGVSWAAPWCAASASALVCAVLEIVRVPGNPYVLILLALLAFAVLSFGIVIIKDRRAPASRPEQRLIDKAHE